MLNVVDRFKQDMPCRDIFLSFGDQILTTFILMLFIPNNDISLNHFKMFMIYMTLCKLSSAFSLFHHTPSTLETLDIESLHTVHRPKVTFPSFQTMRSAHALYDEEGSRPDYQNA